LPLKGRTEVSIFATVNLSFLYFEQTKDFCPSYNTLYKTKTAN